MADLAFYSTFLITFIMSVVFVLIIRGRIRDKLSSERLGKNMYIVLVLCSGLISGSAAFPALASLFGSLGYPSSNGHGEALIAAPIFNLVFAGLLSIFGRILLSWRPIKF